MSDGRILDWSKADGSWRLWDYNGSAADVLPGNPVQSGKWSSIVSGHRLVTLPDGHVLDVDVAGNWRLWNYVPTDTDVLQGPVKTGTWSTINSYHSLLWVRDGRILDWNPGTGAWRLWNYDYTKDDILPGNPVQQGSWATIRNGHELVPMTDGNVLDVDGSGNWRLWAYDPTKPDVLPGNPVKSGSWHTIDSSHELAVMADGHVLDFNNVGGAWRLWKYDNTQPDVLPGNPVQSGNWATIGDPTALHFSKPNGDGPASGNWWASLDLSSDGTAHFNTHVHTAVDAPINVVAGAAVYTGKTLFLFYAGGTSGSVGSVGDFNYDGSVNNSSIKAEWDDICGGSVSFSANGEIDFPLVPSKAQEMLIQAVTGYSSSTPVITVINELQ